MQESVLTLRNQYTILYTISPTDRTRNDILLTHLNSFLSQCSLVISTMDFVCVPEICSKMLGIKDQYLCAAHQSPRSCSALDYAHHTIAQLQTHLKSRSVRLTLSLLSTVFRRLIRVFYHLAAYHFIHFLAVEVCRILLCCYLYFPSYRERHYYISV